LSRDERFKMRDKKIHKITRDGLVERNKATGEESRISQREQDFKLRDRLVDDGMVRDRASASGRGSHSQRRSQAPPSQELRQDEAPSRNDESLMGISGADIALSQDTLPNMPHTVERPGRLQFDFSAPDSPAGKRPSQHDTKHLKQFHSSKSEGAIGSKGQATSPLRDFSEGDVVGKSSRLQFGEDEIPPKTDSPKGGCAKPNKRLEKSRLKAERSAQKWAMAEEKLPTRVKPRREKVFDAEKGKVKRRLRFEQEVRSQQAHLKGSLPLRPVKAGANAAIRCAHTKIHQAEQENVGVEAGHKAELLTEGLARHVYRIHKTTPYRRVAKWERLSRKHTAGHAYQQALHDHPVLRSNALSRFLQKQKIKRQYANMAREAKGGANVIKKAGETTVKFTQTVLSFSRRHPVGVSATLLITMMAFLIMTMFSSCSNMALGILSSVSASSYIAEDKDIDDAALAYTEWETNLQIQIDSAEADHPGFDEYRYHLDDIRHNPYELIAYLTAKYQDFTFASVQAELRTIFEEQYTLSFEEEVEIRYRTETRTDTWTDEEGNTHTDTYEEEVPYEWHILNINLDARSFSDIILPRMNGNEQEHFDVLMSTKGNRQYALNPFATNWLPYVTSSYGWRVHPISGEKDYHKGIDIALPAGTEILATHDGRVAFAGNSGDYGLVAVLENDKGLVTKYAHCSQLLVSTGQEVKKGDLIAKLGSSGNSTGPHLHFEVIYHAQYLNPLFFSETGDGT
jgi:murein DD-endopeptidase MepM/ murein hydrolase activator NlpD